MSKELCKHRLPTVRKLCSHGFLKPLLVIQYTFWYTFNVWYNVALLVQFRGWWRYYMPHKTIRCFNLSHSNAFDNITLASNIQLILRLPFINNYVVNNTPLAKWYTVRFVILNDRWFAVWNGGEEFSQFYYVYYDVAHPNCYNYTSINNQNALGR